jgi:hypothetical protein
VAGLPAAGGTGGRHSASTPREATQAAGITGLLAFDGMRFCQHLEGPRCAGIEAHNGEAKSALAR